MHLYQPLGSLPKEKPPMNVVGDVGGRIAIIVVSTFWLWCYHRTVELEHIGECPLTLFASLPYVPRFPIDFHKHKF